MEAGMPVFPHQAKRNDRRGSMIIRTATCALLAAVLLAGCGKKEEQAQEQAPAASAPATTNQTASTAAPAAAPAASGAKIGNCDVVGPKGSTPIASPAKPG